MLSRQPYKGQHRNLVIAFDVGTTYSGISYCILNPGEVPKILGVSRFPAQEHIGGDNKIPSIMYYDQKSIVRAIGAETSQPHIIKQAEDENWIKLQWWKLHLRGKHLAASHIRDGNIPPLPRGKTAVQVLGDFMRYLFACTRTYIVKSHVDGASLWRSVENRIEFVLTHPNGWEGLQQQQIRQAAELAGLIPSGDKHQARIHLLTEGEASLHFCVNNVLASEVLSKMSIACSDRPVGYYVQKPKQQGVVVIDAGGGIINASAYSMKRSSPMSFEEIAPAECRLQGSHFVAHRAHNFIEGELAGSPYGAPEIVQQMKDAFDASTGLGHSDAEDPRHTEVSSACEMDIQCDIRSGQLELAVEEVAGTFESEPSDQGIAEVFKDRCIEAAMPSDKARGGWIEERANSPNHQPELAQQAEGVPDTNTKLGFGHGEAGDREHIEAGSAHDVDVHCETRSGELELAREYVDNAFERLPQEVSKVSEGQCREMVIIASDCVEDLGFIRSVEEVSDTSDNDQPKLAWEESGVERASELLPQQVSEVSEGQCSETVITASDCIEGIRRVEEVSDASQPQLVWEESGIEKASELLPQQVEVSADQCRETVIAASDCIEGLGFIRPVEEVSEVSEHPCRETVITASDCIEDIRRVEEVSDASTELRFRDGAGNPLYIKVGSDPEMDLQYDACSGQLKLAGKDVAKFFEPSVQEIADAFQKQRRATAIPINHAFLVGGYAASNFLHQGIQNHPAFSGVQLCRPGSHGNKAVADGAVSFHIDHLVTSRTARFTYGIECLHYYDPNLAEHWERKKTQFIGPAGHVMLPKGFSSILIKGTQVSEEQEFRQSFVADRVSRSEFTSVETPILAYRGSHLRPIWVDKEAAYFTDMCTVIADTSKLIYSMSPRQSLNGGIYYRLDIDVILLFGLTELKAQISWKHGGVEKRSPASIVYSEI